MGWPEPLRTVTSWSRIVRQTANSPLNRVGTVVLIVTVLAILPIAAGASLPDPTWIAGLYDAADGDDVVALVRETAAQGHGPTYRLVALLRSSEELTTRPAASYETSQSPQSTRSSPQPSSQSTRGPPRPSHLGITTALLTASRPACFNRHCFTSCVPGPGFPLPHSIPTLVV